MSLWPHPTLLKNMTPQELVRYDLVGLRAVLEARQTQIVGFGSEEEFDKAVQEAVIDADHEINDLEKTLAEKDAYIKELEEAMYGRSFIEVQ